MGEERDQSGGRGAGKRFQVLKYKTLSFLFLAHKGKDENVKNEISLVC